jgi:DNA replication and repair protein RecF
VTGLRCQRLHLNTFRNHNSTAIGQFAPKINVFSGPNGAGKTSILEALSVLSLTKSFTSSDDRSLVHTGSTSFNLQATFLSELDVELHVRIEYQTGPPAKKSIVVNNDRLRSSSELIGRMPIVSLTPDDKAITSGPPDERRRFLNVVLSQASSSYLRDEIEYRKALRHRNSLLGELKQRSSAASIAMLAPWTEMLIKFGTPIMFRRAKFVGEFRPYLEESYAMLSEQREVPSFWYAPMGLQAPIGSEADARELLALEFKARESDEFRRGVTLVGPHRDDLHILIDPEREAKRFASQGQHKTLLVAMKFAEYKYLEDASHEKPILLLDDLFSELDAERSARLLDLVSQEHFGQTFITSTTRETFDHIIDMRHSQNKLFVVESGIVTNF